MAGSTQIGSASVVLSASADGLVSGFAAADAKVRAFGAGVGKSLEASAKGAGGGGLLAKLTGGGGLGKLAGAAALGGAFGVAAAGASKLVDTVAGLPALFASLPQKMGDLAKNVSAADAGGLSAIGTSAARITQLVERAAGMVLAKLGPAFLMAKGIAERLFERAGPLLNAMGERLNAVAAVAVEAFGAVADAVLDVIDSVGAWAAETLGLSGTTQTAGQQMFEVFRLVGTAVAYVWDTLKAGAGAVAYVAGLIVQGFGEVVRAIGEAVKGVADLAGRLPDAIRPDWLAGAGEAVAGWGDKVDAAGKRIRTWGRDAVAGFGESAPKLVAWIDGVEARVNRAKDSIADVQIARQLSGAFRKESVEAYSIVAKFNNSARPTDAAQQQLRKTDETNRILADIRRRLEAGERIEIKPF